jgi:hypothetical protein
MKRGQRNPNSQGAFHRNKVADKRPGPQRRASRIEDDLMIGAAEALGGIASLVGDSGADRACSADGVQLAAVDPGARGWPARRPSSFTPWWSGTARPCEMTLWPSCLRRAVTMRRSQLRPRRRRARRTNKPSNFPTNAAITAACRGERCWGNHAL